MSSPAAVSPTTPAARRAGVRFASEDAVAAEVRRLRRGYARAGNWSLEQICWHLDQTTRSRMAPPPFPPNTPEQDARRALLEQVLASGELSLIQAPDAFVPPADPGPGAVDAFLRTLEKYKAFYQPTIHHRVFGQLDWEAGKRINRIHCARHLSHLVPTAPARRENLSFASGEAVARDVERLRRGHVQVGRWTLPQAAWHVGGVLHACLKPLPPGAASTPEQAALKAKLIDSLLAAGRMPPAIPTAPETDPLGDTAPAALGDDEVDKLIAAFRAMDGFADARVAFGPFGVVTVDEFRQFNLLHAANHLANLVPTAPARREHLTLRTTDEVIAEVERLRAAGCDPAGRWSLAQTCWHLSAPLKYSMMRHRREPPPNTPEQTAAYETMGKAILAGRARIPSGIPTDDRLVPPADAPEKAIDDFIALAREFDTHGAPFPIHPLFGRLTPEEWKQFNLLHAAHHLGHLVPRTA